MIRAKHIGSILLCATLVTGLAYAKSGKTNTPTSIARTPRLTVTDRAWPEDVLAFCPFSGAPNIEDVVTVRPEPIRARSWCQLVPACCSPNPIPAADPLESTAC